MPRQTKPRAADVARWVAILSTPLPSPFMRCDYRAAVREQRDARSALRSWGLDDHGNAPLATEDFAYAETVEREALAERVAS